MDWMDPTWLLDRFGAELFWISRHRLRRVRAVLPVPPGRTLLFALGLFINAEKIDLFPGGPVVELLVAFVLLSVAAFLGNVVGYEIGRAIGPPLYHCDGRFLKRKYFDQTHEFFQRHGNRGAGHRRFVPFVRTFVTVVAGVTGWSGAASSSGALSAPCFWVGSILLLGYTLGQAFPSLGENIDKALIAILAFTVIPIAWEWVTPPPRPQPPPAATPPSCRRPGRSPPESGQEA